MIGIAGAGAFGTALAASLGQTSDVMLLARDPDVARSIQRTATNPKRLPGVTLPSRVTATSRPEDIAACDTVLIAVPAAQIEGFVAQHLADYAGTLVACAKGLDLETGIGPARVIERAAPGASAAILTGPSFALDIGMGLPTALTVACKDSALAEQLRRQLSTPRLRVYSTTDIVGAEVGGALKNVIAIACGVAIGAGYGQSARAAVLARGFSEMQRIAIALGARPETLVGLSGLGDLTLTATSDKSRNFSCGLAIGAGERPDGASTIEGLRTAIAARALAARLGLDLPVHETTAKLVEGEISPQDALEALLVRPDRSE